MTFQYLLFALDFSHHQPRKRVLYVSHYGNVTIQG